MPPKKMYPQYWRQNWRHNRNPVKKRTPFSGRIYAALAEVLLNNHKVVIGEVPLNVTFFECVAEVRDSPNS
jgi:hypothetical protein